MSGMPFDLPEQPEAFARRIERVKGGLRKRCGPGIRATSAVSEALVGALNEMKDGKTPVGFWTRVTRQAINLLRRDQALNRALDRRARSGAHEAMMDPAEEAAAAELQQILDQIVADLHESEQQIWRLLRLGHSHDEIAELLDKSRDAIKMAVCRIRKKIAQRLPDSQGRKEAANA